MNTKSLSIAVLTISTLLFSANPACAQGSSFTYQGQLRDTNGPVTNTVNLQFQIYATASGGLPVWQETHVGVPVSNGLFSVALGRTTPADEGVFTGAARWLGISINGGIELTPRTQLTAAPYAITAGHLAGVLASASLSGTYSATVNFSSTANSFTGNGQGLTVNASRLASGIVPDARLSANVARTNQVWLLNGNNGTSSGTHFLGTADDEPLELKVNGWRGLRLEPNTNGSPNVIAGAGNFVAPRVIGATIAGGGGPANLTGYSNSIFSDFSVIGGGRGHNIASNSSRSTIAGGEGNNIATNSGLSTISGGTDNRIQGGALGATIAGGAFNEVQNDSYFSTISGGRDHRIGRHSELCTVAGGFSNWIMTNCAQSVIAGGVFNIINASSSQSVIGGGGDNRIHANSPHATIPGGDENAATNRAFAAGTRAKAIHTGAFVWADSQALDFPSTANNQVSFRCQGGIRFTSGAGTANQTVAWTPGNASWTFSSDRNLKEGFSSIEPQAVLEKVSRLPVTQWHYKGHSQRHIGPTAQDFHELFPLNEDERMIDSGDLHGISLAAIQGLNQKLEAQLRARDAQIEALRQELAVLKHLVGR